MVSQVAVARADAPGEARAILLFACAEFLDVATTLIGLRSGQFREANPLAGGAAPVDLLMALKLLTVLAIILVVHRFVSQRRRTAALVVMATIAMTAPALNAAHILAAR